MAARPDPAPAPAPGSLLEFADRAAGSAAPGAGAPQPGPQAGSPLHLITFRLDAEEFALPIAAVREVIRVGEITRVPQAPEHVRGITNLRGRIVPVVELRTRLGLAPLVPTPRARIIVAETQGRLIGLLVDEVAQVLKLPAERVVAAPDEVRPAAGDHVTGVAQLGERLVILLDLERALTGAASSHT